MYSCILFNLKGRTLHNFIYILLSFGFISLLFCLSAFSSQLFLFQIFLAFLFFFLHPFFLFVTIPFFSDSFRTMSHLLHIHLFPFFICSSFFVFLSYLFIYPTTFFINLSISWDLQQIKKNFFSSFTCNEQNLDNILNIKTELKKKNYYERKNMVQTQVQQVFLYKLIVFAYAKLSRQKNERINLSSHAIRR